MNVYEESELDPVPVKKAEIAPKSKSLRTQLNELIEKGGELTTACSIEEFGSLFYEFKPVRRQCKLSMEYRDGKLYASARL